MSKKISRKKRLLHVEFSLGASKSLKKYSSNITDEMKLKFIEKYYKFNRLRYKLSVNRNIFMFIPLMSYLDFYLTGYKGLVYDLLAAIKFK